MPGVEIDDSTGIVCGVAESVEVTNAARFAADTAWSCPEALSCASTHGTRSSAFAPFANMPRLASPAFAVFTTRVAGATANTNTLAVVPTSSGRGWNVAVAFATVGVMLAFTVTGKRWGACATRVKPVKVL